MKLLIGSGITKKDGYKRVDFDKTVKPDYVLNVEKQRWPFKTNSVDKILAENVLEHLTDLDFFMEQAYRVLKPKGELEILVPYYTIMLIRIRIILGILQNIRLYTGTAEPKAAMEGS